MRGVLVGVAWADLVVRHALQAAGALALMGMIVLREDDLMWDRIVKGLCLAVGAVAGLYGGWSATLTILAVMMAVDYVTGIVVAASGRSDKTEGGGLSSKVGFAGIARKGFIMLIVLVATLLDRAIGNTSMVFQTATVFYYIANEGLSILENAERMGVPFPAFIRKRLESMREERDAVSGEP